MPESSAVSVSGPSSGGAPFIVLIHGAWHGGWCWASLQGELDRLGVASYAIDLPGRGTTAAPAEAGPNVGLIGDIESVDEFLDELAAQRPGQRVLLVGHSYGGAVVSATAAHHPNVAGAVIVAGFALNAGESVNGFLRSAPRHRVGLAEFMRPADDGSITLEGDVAQIYTGVDARVAAACAARVTVQPPNTFAAPVPTSAVGEVPITYVVCTDDDAVAVEHQRLLAQRCDRTIEIPGGHFPMLSDPAKLAEILAGALPESLV